MPVVDVEQRREGIPPESGQVEQSVRTRPAERRVEHDVQRERGQYQEERRQQPPGASPPERDEVDAARAHPLLEQQRGDEESGEDEEQVDAEVAARGPTELEVVGDHGGHRHTAQARERGQLPARDGRRRARVPFLESGTS